MVMIAFIELILNDDRRPVLVLRHEIDPFRKHCLLNGLDDIGLSLEKVAKIDDYEAKQRQERPSERPVRLMVRRNCLGMILSVSTLIIGKGAAVALRVVNLSMACVLRSSPARARRRCGRPISTRRS